VTVICHLVEPKAHKQRFRRRLNDRWKPVSRSEG
jgi:hypothetical protein